MHKVLAGRVSANESQFESAVILSRAFLCWLRNSLALRHARQGRKSPGQKPGTLTASLVTCPLPARQPVLGRLCLGGLALGTPLSSRSTDTDDKHLQPEFLPMHTRQKPGAKPFFGHIGRKGEQGSPV